MVLRCFQSLKERFIVVLPPFFRRGLSRLSSEKPPPQRFFPCKQTKKGKPPPDKGKIDDLHEKSESDPKALGDHPERFDKYRQQRYDYRKDSVNDQNNTVPSH